MSESFKLTIDINNCSKDCPYFSARAADHWTGGISGYVYDCLKAEKMIMPTDGVEPPPKWCPIRPVDISLQEHVQKLMDAGHQFYKTAVESDTASMRDFEGFDEWETKAKELLR